VGGDRSAERVELAYRVVGCSGLLTRDIVLVSQLLYENGPGHKILNRWGNRKGIE
jgi:hypothetical protein